MVKITGLGRGLDALLNNHTDEENTSRLMVIPLSAICQGKYQPRKIMDAAELEELADSIREQGVIQPIIVREVGIGEFELIAGERRWRACKIAGLSEIPAVVKVVSDEAVLAMALIENIQRADLGPMEEAQGLKRLIDEFGMTHEAVATAVGRSRSAVSNLLRLLQLPEPVQGLLHEKKLEMGHARALLTLPVLNQIALADQAVQQGWSVREMERRCKKDYQLEPTTFSQKSEKLNTDSLEESVSSILGACVKIKAGKKGGHIIIKYGDLDELDDLLKKLAPGYSQEV